MPNLWNLIKGKSSILSGTTYGHLTSPDIDTQTIFVSEYYLESDIIQFELELPNQSFYLELENPSFEIEITTPQYYLEIEDA